ncbi:MAG: 16S rRNA (guanine(527)-N(7))-methyltransferase RsmG [Erythrobacter sp.]
MSDKPALADESAAREFVRDRVDEVAFDRLERFSDLLIAENKHQNLISRPSESLIWQRHIADSVQLLDHVPRETREGGGAWLDLGTGAGFPGIVLAAILPTPQINLVESRAKRIEFLQRMVTELDLDRCTVLGQRLETIKPFPARVITARAFAPLDKLLRLSAPFSTKETRYVLPKGRSAAHELDQLKAPIRKMFHVEQSLTDPEAGIILSK